jgi:hypothetical protein
MFDVFCCLLKMVSVTVSFLLLLNDISALNYNNT